MTDPTEGPCFVENNQVWHENGLACIAEAYSGVALQVDPDQNQQEANARLICIAFNAAHAAKELGFDPIAAIEALPFLLEKLEKIQNCSHHKTAWSIATAALDKARTRKD